jgi:uncharacterized iron-regulated protein
MKTLSFLFLFISCSVFAQDPSAYKWFTGSGKKTSFEKLVKATDGVDFVFFGELHDDPVAHWMQNELAKRLYANAGGRLMIGEEMLERHQQQAVDNFLSGKWDAKTLQDSAKMWSNFKTDYLPLLDWAREHQQKVIATNITRKYASLVFKKGLKALDSLSQAEKDMIVPLDIFTIDTSLSQYRELVKMGMEMHASGYDFACAQAIKDATMADAIAQHWERGTPFLHLNGAYHSDFHQGIVWYLKRALKDIQIITITTVTQSQLEKLDKEFLEKADFILVVPEGMTRTM